MNTKGGQGGKKQKLPVLFVGLFWSLWGLRTERPHPVLTPFSVWNVLVKEPGGGAGVAVGS